MHVVFWVGGAALILIGIAILVFRTRYAAWWNRVYRKRGQAESFSVSQSVVYGIFALGMGALMVIVWGILGR